MDFIEFISKKRNRTYEEIQDIFAATKNEFKFSGPQYRNLSTSIHSLNKILHDDIDEKELVGSYQFHELLHLFRFISYTYSDDKPIARNYFKSFVRSVLRGHFFKIFNFVKSKILREGITKDNAAKKKAHSFIAQHLLQQLNSEAPVIVDYGCGLGHISFEIGKLKKNSKIFLVDIDCLTLDFAEFRFRKHGFNFEVIRITEDNLYPKLPKHNICIATEVMEHVVKPLTVYNNIYSNLDMNGILYGSYDDHNIEMFHISPDLSSLREEISVSFEKINHMSYKKMK